MNKDKTDNYGSDVCFCVMEKHVSLIETTMNAERERERELVVYNFVANSQYNPWYLDQLT